jgi:hypothetical protein
MVADEFAAPFSDRGHGLASILVESEAYELVLVDISAQDQSSISVRQGSLGNDLAPSSSVIVAGRSERASQLNLRRLAS